MFLLFTFLWPLSFCVSTPSGLARLIWRKFVVGMTFWWCSGGDCVSGLMRTTASFLFLYSFFNGFSDYDLPCLSPDSVAKGDIFFFFLFFRSRKPLWLSGSCTEEPIFPVIYNALKIAALLWRCLNRVSRIQ